MKICIVTDRRKGFNVRLPACEIALFPFGTAGCVDYAAELSGKEEKLERLARLSGTAKCGILCGCITDSRGIVRKSVAAAYSGRLLGIADMLHVLDGDEIKCGASVSIFSAGGVKVGACIGNDLYFPECIKAMVMCGCNIISVHAESISDGMPPLLIRSYAYLYGVPIALCAPGAAYFADITGVMASSNRECCIFEVVPKNCYRLVTTRRRGILTGSGDDY